MRDHSLSNIQQSRFRLWLPVSAGFLMVGIFLLRWRGWMPFEGLVQAMARLDVWIDGRSLAAQPETLHKYYAMSLGTFFVIVGSLIAIAALWNFLSDAARALLYRHAATIACSCAAMIYMLHIEYDGSWSPVKVLLTDPHSLPIYGHRLLFVWVAKIFLRISPHLLPVRAYYLSQLIAVLLAMHVLGRWSALHVGEAFSWAGQVLGLVMLSTCFSYRNFYDVGNVFFITCGLMAIYTRRYWWLVPIMIVGTLNYEGVLLLLPVAAFVAYFEDRTRKWLAPVVASLVIYILVRVAVQAALPMPRQVNWRVWSNMTEPFMLRTNIAFTILALTGWYAVAIMSWRYCDRRVRRLFLLFPLVFVVTLMFGQFTEARQFDAFIPVVVAAVLSASRNRAASLTIEPDRLTDNGKQYEERFSVDAAGPGRLAS